MARTVATNTRVDLGELLDFVRPRHHMVLLLRITPTRWGPVATGGFPPENA
jgi:hypothetical protein